MPSKDALWKPGQSGNPGGRPKEEKEVLALARERSKEAIERLVLIMQGPNDKLAMMAAQAILDRAFGKPRQQMELTGEDGAPVLQGITVSFVKPNADTSGPTGETGSAV